MKVGDYVRTKNGYICKVTNINDFREPNVRYCVDANYLKDFMFIGDEDIYKSSPNIIDLIEVGDYVNGCRVDDIRPTHLYCNEDDDDDFCEIILKENIKSIVTKDQFKAMEYKVGEE